MNYTTIPELSANTNLSTNSIRFQLYKNKIEPVEKVKLNINGFVGQPFKIEDVEKVISSFVPTSERIKIDSDALKEIKKYSHQDVCKVLRNHIKSVLNNKIVSTWNYKDWQEFEELKNTP